MIHSGSKRASLSCLSIFMSLFVVLICVQSSNASEFLGYVRLSLTGKSLKIEFSSERDFSMPLKIDSIEISSYDDCKSRKQAPDWKISNIFYGKKKSGNLPVLKEVYYGIPVKGLFSTKATPLMAGRHYSVTGGGGAYIFSTDFSISQHGDAMNVDIEEPYTFRCHKY